MAKLTTAEFIDAIKELSVLELNELVKACEEEFGVSAAAGVVVAAAGAGAAAAELFVRLQDLDLRKQRISLMEHLRFLRQKFLRMRLRLSRSSLKKLEHRLLLSNLIENFPGDCESSHLF